jgi:acetyltransferase-like isoleucine patch superfamily enzyme
LDSLIEGLIIGTLPSTCGHSEHYFYERYCFIDCRPGGGVLTVSEESNWGIGVKVVLTSHDISDGKFGGMIPKNVTVERLAWICSFAILYNCTIGEGAIVSIGSVVANQWIEPWTAVEGNPAVPIARFVDGKWRHV